MKALLSFHEAFNEDFSILIEFQLDHLNFLYESRNFYTSPANGDGENPKY